MLILVVRVRFPCYASSFFHMGKVNDDVAVLITFGGIESTPVAFLG